MTTSNRILGELGVVDGRASIRFRDTFDTGIDDLWSALTEPDRLARWMGEFTGDLHVGGDFRAMFFASGWEGTGHVEACEPPHRALITTRASDGSEPPNTVELTLTPDGDRTTLVIVQRGTPVELIAEYGAGGQVHVEDLAAYFAGRGRVDAQARWSELLPNYRELAGGL